MSWLLAVIAPYGPCAFLLVCVEVIVDESWSDRACPSRRFVLWSFQLAAIAWIELLAADIVLGKLGKHVDWTDLWAWPVVYVFLWGFRYLAFAFVTVYGTGRIRKFAEAFWRISTSCILIFVPASYCVTNLTCLIKYAIELGNRSNGV